MAKIIAEIITTKWIGSRETAHAFFEILSEAKLLPDKIGLYEPLTMNYSLDEAVNFWTMSEDGCYEEGKGYVGKYGSMLGKKSKPGLLFDMSWWQCPKGNLNHITFFIAPTVYEKNSRCFEYVFQETFKLFDGIYGYITHENPKDRQHVAGTLETRIPGIFWCNYYGKIYTDFFGKERILSAPWFMINELDDYSTVITYLDETPMSPVILDDDHLANKIKQSLGSDSFGDPEEERLNHESGNYDVYQRRNVPKIFDV